MNQKKNTTLVGAKETPETWVISQLSFFGYEPTELLDEMELNIIAIRCWSLYLPAGNKTIWLE